MKNPSGYIDKLNLTSTNPSTRLGAYTLRLEAGLIIIFLTASYLVLLIPGWNTIVIAGTLIVYYTVINLHGERKT